MKNTVNEHYSFQYLYLQAKPLKCIYSVNCGMEQKEKERRKDDDDDDEEE